LVYALFGAVAIGMSLGLLGSGGSILTVPILVFLVGHAEKQAVAESYAIVGAISLFGGIRASIKRKVDGRSVMLWAIPGMIGAAAGVELSHLISGSVQLLLLGCIMLVAAASMLRSKAPASEESRRPAPLLVAACGLGIGIVTGLVGIGGGFLIVPALVLLTGTPMHRAVGTSLCVIAINSATGLGKFFLSPDGREIGVHWGTIGVFVCLGIIGSYIGAMIGSKLNQRALKRVFAVFLIVLGVFVIWKQSEKVRRGASESAGTPHALTPAAGSPGG
jgi:uncharacterized membrane protein YfcA